MSKSYEKGEKNSQSPRSKREGNRDPVEMRNNKSEVSWHNDSGPAERNRQPSPFRHLDASDGREDGRPV